ncbi:hypothetical protein RCH07_003084 [Arthrobacter sp. CG_A4]|nr:hypothetical protein [Arthrobacter sp. CG_A4]
MVYVLLDADEATLRNRFESDQVEFSGKQWRLDHLERYAATRQWLTHEAGLVSDTSQQ